ncbi:MAG: dienelactone hydrolase family protein [Rhizobacter sp.]|nr:dienelactone hydrolase family protein [Chlorobiales bacterium]
MKKILILALALFIALSAQAAEKGKTVKYKSGKDDVSGYLAMPEKKGTYPAVIMVHEWNGLNDWVKAQADDLASKGYVVLAVDLYRGKVGKTKEEAQALMQGLSKDRAAEDLKASYAYIETLDETKGQKVGSIGWCMGGGYALATAQILSEKLSACVVCYGFVTTDKKELAPVKAKVLGIFGGKDTGIPVDKTVKPFEAALKENGNKDVEIKVYPNSGHAFMNATNGMNTYNEADAKDAWAKTIAFFGKNLAK